MNTNDKLSEIIIRSWSDDDFKKQLIENPINIFKEYGIELNEKTKKIKIVENSEEENFFILPKKPNNIDLSESELKQLVERMVVTQLVLPTI